MAGTIYLYVLDTMADWEIGYLTAELNTGRYFKKGLSPAKIITLGLEKTPVTTMGGLKITPEISLAEWNLQNTEALILPGGDTWLEDTQKPILDIAAECLKENRLVAAICGATFGLAKAGLLDSSWHTSNDLGYLKAVCPEYKGEKYYKNEPAVTDGKLITASGIAPLEFTAQVIKALDVFKPETLDIWYKLYQTKKPEYFFELMNSIQ